MTMNFFSRILTVSQTEDTHAAAWGGYSVLGRVRLSDGLVVLKRESVGGLTPWFLKFPIDISMTVNWAGFNPS